MASFSPPSISNNPYLYCNDNLQSQLNGKADGSKMRCHFDQVGWYRIVKYDCPIEPMVMGGYGNGLMLSVKMMYNNETNMSFMVLLNAAYTTSNFTILGKNANKYTITKLRHTIDSANKKAYIEIYYDRNSNNECFLELSRFADIGNKWELINPEPTTETVSGVEVYSTADLESEDRQVVTKSDLAVLSGNPTTNRTLPKQSTTINQLILQSGNYIISSYFSFKEGFPDLVDAIINVNGSDRITVRGTGIAGGGLTPVYICKITSTTTIESRAYQGSATEKEINYNILTAIKLA